MKEIPSDMNGGKPMTSATNAIVTYTNPYSYTNPLPGPGHNPSNVAASIDSNLGVVSFLSYTNGAFVTSVKVSAYKAGILVAEVWRDMQFVLLPCQSNNPPVMPGISGMAQMPADHRIYCDTVYAGDLVSLPVNVADFDVNPNSTLQSVRLNAYSFQFGQNYTNTQIGCRSVPCATLMPPPPLTGLTTTQTQLIWQTECSTLPHCIYCGSNVYDFYFEARDDFCPAPARSAMTLRIVVLPPPEVHAPAIRCSELLTNGAIRLSWAPVSDTIGNLRKLYLYRSENRNGPWLLIDSLTDFSITEYTDSSVLSNNIGYHYLMRSLSGCARQPGNATDTLSTLFLQAMADSLGSGWVNLDWNPPSANYTSPFRYLIYEQQTPQLKVLLDSSFQTHYSTSYNPLSPPLGYVVEQVCGKGIDSLGQMQYCTSVSNLAHIAYAGIEKHPTLPGVRIVPNPFDGLFRIYIEEPLPSFSGVSLQIFAPDGSEVYREEMSGTNGQVIHLHDLRAGIYFLVLRSNDSYSVHKVVKTAL
jgi:hypothetical protein